MESPRYTRPKDKVRERSSSPFRRNVVEPLSSQDGTGDVPASNHGSMVSVRSEASTTSKGLLNLHPWKKKNGVFIKIDENSCSD
jgi:hypothetical protein